jgi:hypothetical protein
MEQDATKNRRGKPLAVYPPERLNSGGMTDAATSRS